MIMERKYVEFDRLDDLGFRTGPRKEWVVWEIRCSQEQDQHFQKLLGIYHSENLFEVVDFFGAGSILSIGGLIGELIEPETMLEMRYSGGKLMERSWQYLWKPNNISRQLINVEMDVQNQSHVEKRTAFFRRLIPRQATKHSTSTIEVTEIPLRILPEIFKSGLTWRLEKAFSIAPTPQTTPA